MGRFTGARKDNGMRMAMPLNSKRKRKKEMAGGEKGDGFISNIESGDEKKKKNRGGEFDG